ncbi:hypothetical protein N9Y42_02500 [Mariniblastus sp.]|nr:hypothetical protein [Mariniblastus sp.]
MRQSFILAVALLTLFCSSAHAQNPQRRELIQGLLKGLIESQLEKGRAVPQPQPYPPQNRPGQRVPGQRNPGRNGPGGGAVTIEVSKEMLGARQTLNQWNTASAGLVDELRQHEHQAPQLRSLLADSMRFQASVGGLSRRAELMPTIGPLKNDFAALDRDWRMISNRVKTTRGVPANCQGYVNTINDLDSQLCDVFQLEPQVNRVELNRLATTMNNDFDHLLRGLFFSRGPNNNQKLIRDGQQLQAKIGQAASLVSRGSYTDLVNAYEVCLKDWRKFSRRVLKLRDERLKFSIQHIEDNGRLIQQQLFIPVELDRSYLASVTAGLTIDSEQLFQNISMADLLKHPNPLQTINQGRAFTAACVKLNQDIEKNVAEDQLAWSYLAFSKSWDAVHGSLHGLKSPVIDRRLENVTLTVNSLGEVLGSNAVLSHDELVHLLSDLDALCRQGAFDAHKYIDEPRYTSTFHSQMCGGFDELQRQAYAIHRDSVQPTYKVNPATLQPMFQQWESIRPLIKQCKGADKNRFNKYRQEIEPMMVKLQILYGA